MDDVAPTRRGSRVRFAAPDVAIEVDAALGGRVVEYSVDGRNVLFEQSGDGDNHGSTFWTSPQAAWSWPPPPEIDREPYEIVPCKDGISLVSRPSRLLGVSVGKAFSLARDGSVTIDYRIRNESEAPRSVAPWEVTRVARRGTSFFPYGSNVRASPRFPAPSFSESLGVVWVDHDSNGAKDRKLHADGPINWLAHSESGLLFLKTFESLSPGTEAPGEALVEIFVSGGAPYVELEQQGAYRSLEPGKAIIWRVHWRLVRAHPEVGKSELFALVRSLLEVTPR